MWQTWRIYCFIVRKGKSWLRKNEDISMKKACIPQRHWLLDEQLNWCRVLKCKFSFGKFFAPLLHQVKNVIHEVECGKQLTFWKGKFQRNSKLKWKIPFWYSLLDLFWFSCITFPEFSVLEFLLFGFCFCFCFVFVFFLIYVRACMCVCVICDILTVFTFFINWNNLGFFCKICNYIFHLKSSWKQTLACWNSPGLNEFRFLRSCSASWEFL